LITARTSLLFLKGGIHPMGDPQAVTRVSR
jgi:hypothetical protein